MVCQKIEEVVGTGYMDIREWLNKCMECMILFKWLLREWESGFVLAEIAEGRRMRLRGSRLRERSEYK